MTAPDVSMMRKSGLRILLVEPRPFQVFDIETVLYQIECYLISPVLVTSQLKDLLNTARHEYDLAICTSGSFGMSDLELMDLLCKNRKVHNVLLLATYDAEKRQDLLIRAGRLRLPLLGFLEKPLTAFDLSKMLARLPRWSGPIRNASCAGLVRS